MKKVDATELTRKTAEILNNVHFYGQRYLVERHGKPQVVILPAKEVLILSEKQEQVKKEK